MRVFFSNAVSKYHLTPKKQNCVSAFPAFAIVRYVSYSHKKGYAIWVISLRETNRYKGIREVVLKSCVKRDKRSGV